MQNLIEITNLLTRKRLKKIEMLDNTILNGKANKLGELYNGISQGLFNTDNEAAAKLYDSTPSDGRYTRLKSVFRKRLLNNIFYLDVNDPSFSNLHQARLSCNRNMALCNILGTYGARNTAIKLAKKTIVKSQLYTFNDIVVSCARLLKGYYSLMGDFKSYSKYREISKYHMQMHLADMKAEESYQDLIIHYSKSVSFKRELAQEALKYLRELEDPVLKFNSFTLHYYFYKIKALRFEIEGNYRDSLTVYEDLAQYLDDNPVFKQTTLIATLNLNKLDCYLHLNDFTNGEKTAKLSLQYFSTSNLNRFILLENYFLLALRTKNYIKAKEIFNELVYDPKFDYFTEDRKEKWRIFEAYMNFLYENSSVDQEELLKYRTKRFNLNKFINDVPNYSKDKRGYNLAILIIHILYLLKREDFGGIIDRTLSLQIYRNRYLKGDEDLRSKHFIKMLLIMEKESFDYESTKEKASKYLEKLKAENYRHEGTAIDAEIIPYEDLWEIVFKILQKH